ncbi:MAG: hypothetical protein NXY59_04945 [Aigarchaeota archaeon]|nr:hypothetical protein [Candidatus Pelearchaeum maunauluense]
MSLIRPGRWSEEHKLEVLRSSIGNAMINLKLLIDSPLAVEMQLLTEDERKRLMDAVEVVRNVMKRAKEKGLIK